MVLRFNSRSKKVLILLAVLLTVLFSITLSITYNFAQRQKREFAINAIGNYRLYTTDYLIDLDSRVLECAMNSNFSSSIFKEDENENFVILKVLHNNTEIQNSNGQQFKLIVARLVKQQTPTISSTIYSSEQGLYGYRKVKVSDIEVEYLYDLNKLINYQHDVYGINSAIELSTLENSDKSVNLDDEMAVEPIVTYSKKGQTLAVNLAQFYEIDGTYLGRLVVFANFKSIGNLIFWLYLLQGFAFVVLLSILLVMIFHQHKFFRLYARLTQNTKSCELPSISNVIDASENGIRIVNEQFEVLVLNDKIGNISGYKSTEMAASKCFDIFGSVNCHTSNCPIARIFDGEKKVVQEEYRYKFNGEKIKVQVTTSPWYNKNGNLSGIIQEFQDLSEVSTLEQSLKQSELQFQMFTDALPFGVFIEDGITHQVVYQNSYLNSITQNQAIYNFASNCQPRNINTYELEKSESLDLIDSKGNWRFFEMQRFKFIGVNNQLRIGGVLFDVTKRKEIEHYRDVLAMAIENSPVSVLILSAQTEVEFINPSFTEITGITLANAYSKELLSLNLEYNSSNKISEAMRQVSEGKTWQGEIQLKSSSKLRVWVSASFIPLHNDIGALQHIVVVMENITERKEYEKELILSKNQAEESDRLKSVFLANLSHEIRTPLNAIIGFSSLLFDSDIGIDERKNISDIIYRNSNELLRLIENLIDISEIETGNLSIKKSEFSLNALLNDLYRQVIDEDKKATNVRFSLRKEVNLDDLYIYTDKSRLRQVLFHLLTNACKFTERGFIEFGYTLKDESTLLFYVIDSGIGIAPDKQSVVFNPFRQVDESNTRQYYGMGLGLSISKHIVEKLGGKIWLTSQENSGTNVYFSLPYVPVNLKFDGNPLQSLYSKFDWNSKTILITDDMDANYVYLKAALKRTNAQLLWAKNGKEAIELVKSYPSINLVLMDLIMPEMDGFEATQQIKQLNNHIPIIGQTAYPSKHNTEKAIMSGFDSVLEKPIKLNQMLNELDRFLDN